MQARLKSDLADLSWAFLEKLDFDDSADFLLNFYFQFLLELTEKILREGPLLSYSVL